MPFFVNAVFTFQEVRRYLSGISDNIAEVLGVIILAHKLFFDLDSVLVGTETFFDRMDGLIRDILCQNCG